MTTTSSVSGSCSSQLMEGVKLRVAICGAGIGGLSLACALAQYPNISVTIYESAASFDNLGVGLGVWPRAWGVLCKLGVEDEMRKIACAPQVKMENETVHTFTFRKSDQVDGFTFGDVFSRGSVLTFHRAQFQQVFLQRAQKVAPSCCIHHGKRLKSYFYPNPYPKHNHAQTSQAASHPNTQPSATCPTSHIAPKDAEQHLLNADATEEEGPIKLCFEDDTSASCDILVGADGIKSAVRRCLMREVHESELEVLGKRKRGDERDTAEQGPEWKLRNTDYVSWTGSIAYRALIPLDSSPFKELCASGDLRVPEVPIMYIGKDVHIIAYPVSQGPSGPDAVNFAIFHQVQPELHSDELHSGQKRTQIYPGPWSEEVDEADLWNIAQWEEWEPEVRRWIECVRRPTKWAIHCVGPLPTYVSPAAKRRNAGVVLLGDAAHASSPHQGTGAGQAIEDAYVLASLLGTISEHSGSLSETPHTISGVLGLYDRLRRPWTQEASARALRNGRYFCLDWDGFDFSDEGDTSTADASILPQQRTKEAEETAERKGERKELVRSKLSELTARIVEEWEWCWTTTAPEVKESLRN